MEKNKIKITVLGAGISGLATAYWLQKEGFEVTVLEASSQPGGAMISEKEEGYLIDYGPNSGLETTPVIADLVEEVGLQNEIVYANEEGNKRYILRDGNLYPLPTSPGAFFKTKLFSASAKFRLMAEPFIGKSKDGYYQSIAEFVKRRLGQEFLDYAINPFVSGVFAGDPEKLSVKSAFPKLYRLEELYGGLIKGMFLGAKERKANKEKSKNYAKMFSFRNGMQSFPKAIAAKLGDDVKYNCKVSKVESIDSGYKIIYSQNGENKNLETDLVLSTIPSYKTATVFGHFDSELERHLNEIYYPPVMVLFLGFKKEQIGQTLDGFGFLIPEKEERKFLGGIWSSVIFPERAEDGNAAFTIFVGGARSPELFNQDDEKLIAEVIEQFKKIMKINGEPVFRREKFWNKAIPQYNIGHIEHENYFDQFEKNYPGIFLSGNYRGGISVGDCMKNSELTKNRIIEFVKNKRSTEV